MRCSGLRAFTLTVAVTDVLGRLRPAPSLACARCRRPNAE